MGMPVRLMNVSVSDGGIQSHDMRVLQLLRQICGGTLAASTGLSMVTFVPGDLLPGNFSAEAGRLGYVIFHFNHQLADISVRNIVLALCYHNHIYYTSRV